MSVNGWWRRLTQGGGMEGGAIGAKRAILFALGLGAGLWLGLGPGLAEMPPQARAMAAVAAPMAIWWITEAIPIAATALVPLVALPLLGIASPREAAAPYADPNVFLFIGGFIFAVCMERWNLHRRIALTILGWVGASPRRILLGFMGATAFLSMWTSNTATTLMMLPIAMAVVQGRGRHAAGEVPGGAADSAAQARFATCLFLIVAYSASVGGIGTLIGTPPNIVFASMVKRMEAGMPEITFVRWMAIGLPVVVVMLPLVYLILTRVVFPIGAETSLADPGTLERQRQELGPITPAERRIAAVFAVTALLWIFREDIVLGTVTVPGWSGLLAHGKSIHDGTVAVAMALLLFIIPAGRIGGPALMGEDWYRGIPWHIVVLFGGGFALAQGFQSSGLSEQLGARLSFLSGLPPYPMLLAICLFMTFLTELTSNTATTTAMLPILAATAVAGGQPPLLYMLPAAISASCAFMLPVATPPNAIVFGSGHVTVPQMARAGLLINLTSAPLIAWLVWWLAPKVFGE